MEPDTRFVTFVMENGYVYAYFNVAEDMEGDYTTAKKWFVPYLADLPRVILNWLERNELPS